MQRSITIYNNKSLTKGGCVMLRDLIVKELEELSISAVELDGLVDLMAGKGGVGCRDASCAGSCQTNL